jgi:MerR family mercuric resistance operon transcriptional regulator
MRMPNIGIGALSRQTGASIETIRYYERIGLLPIPKRGLTKRRFYTPTDVALLSFIRQARDLGFGLADVRELILLRKDRACRPVAAVANRHLSTVRAKIATLQQIEKRLASAIEGCADEAPDCSLLQALEAEVANTFLGSARKY